jgi:hypothetical protein
MSAAAAPAKATSAVEVRRKYVHKPFSQTFFHGFPVIIHQNTRFGTQLKKLCAFDIKAGDVLAA